MESLSKDFKILLLLYFIKLSIAKTMYMRNVFSQQDVIYLNKNLGQLETRSLLGCANRCIATDACMSMFYHSQTQQCVLHQFSGVYLESQNTTVSYGWTYYEKVGGSGLLSREVQCLAGGFMYDAAVDICYTLKHASSIDFDVFNEECAIMNSQLIRITSQEKQDWIAGVLDTKTEELVCMQGNKDNGLNQFQFHDGTTMSYFNWNIGAGQPEGGPGQHYICMRKSFNYLWHDAGKKLQSEALIICEK